MSVGSSPPLSLQATGAATEIGEGTFGVAAHSTAGVWNWFSPGPHRPRGCLQRAKCHFNSLTVKEQLHLYSPKIISALWRHTRGWCGPRWRRVWQPCSKPFSYPLFPHLRHKVLLFLVLWLQFTFSFTFWLLMSTGTHQNRCASVCFEGRT